VHALTALSVALTGRSGGTSPYRKGRYGSEKRLSALPASAEGPEHSLSHNEESLERVINCSGENVRVALLRCGGVGRCGSWLAAGKDTWGSKACLHLV
jgi:hypothetical protein